LNWDDFQVTKIVIADDNAQVRAALRICLELNPGWQVCGEAENGQAAVDMVQHLQPDVVLLDYSMPIMNGLDAARVITARSPECPLLMFTMFASRQLSTLAREAGIKAVISKDVGGMRAIVEAVRNATRKSS
jgi:DNA-binding NarL/FixJ family response regulator